MTARLEAGIDLLEGKVIRVIQTFSGHLCVVRAMERLFSR